MPCLFDNMALKEYLHKLFVYWMCFSRKEIFFCHSVWNGAIGYDFQSVIVPIYGRRNTIHPFVMDNSIGPGLSEGILIK